MPFVFNSLTASPATSAGPRSWLLEEFLNYFPDTDRRVRFLRHSLDAQFLNAFALAAEDHERRLAREARAQSFRAPLNLDNCGVWQKCYVPSDYTLGATADGDLAPPGAIEGQLPDSSQFVAVRPYDDCLPIPSRAEFDSSRAPVAVGDPLVFTVTGTDYPQRLAPETPELAFPNCLWLVLADLPDNAGPVEVSLTGMAWPSPVEGYPAPVTERLVFPDEGVLVSQTAFSTLTGVEVRGLAAGAKLQGFLFLASGPVPDPRPAIDPDWRGQRFRRYWQLDGALLKDTFTRGRFTGYEVAESYLCRPALAAIAAEPNTCGLWAAAGTTLYYTDRRSQMPDGLGATGLRIEPAWSLDVRYDPSHPGPIRYVRLSPDSSADGDGAVQYRYSVTLPESATWLLTPQGALAPFTAYGGWRAGAPPELSMALTATGTYLFALETADASGRVTKDVCPYRNAAFQPLAAFDLSSIVPGIQGIVFDALERLWIWSGDFLVPLLLHYDAYLFDPAERALYLTDAYDQVQLWT